MKKALTSCFICCVNPLFEWAFLLENLMVREVPMPSGMLMLVSWKSVSHKTGDDMLDCDSTQVEYYVFKANRLIRFRV